MWHRAGPGIPAGGSQEFMLDEGEILTLATAEFGGPRGNQGTS